MKTVFFTWITDNYRNSNIDFDSFYKSFKYFHNDIDLVVFNDKDINSLKTKKPWISNTNCKASFAQLLYKDYDLVVNIDSDFYFFDRCVEILDANYDIAACANYNAVHNTAIPQRNIEGLEIKPVGFLDYIQGGLIASTNTNFWDEYEDLSKKLSNRFSNYENDILNIIWYNNKYITKILDGDRDYRSDNFKCYYNCSSLGRISGCKVINDKIILDNKPMRCYHVAHGWKERKKRVQELFPKEVSDWFYSKINTIK